MRHLDLFSGIGGFALAASRVWPDHQPWFCEKDKYCQKILKKHWPKAPICEDIHELKPMQRCDLVTGGFPCQPFSTAGKQRGTDDDRYLWPEMLRIIREAKPTWVVGENVPGIIGMALDQVLIDLEMEGYACQCLIIPACGVDAPHRRNRVWIVANATSSRRAKDQVSYTSNSKSSKLWNSCDTFGVQIAGDGRGYERYPKDIRVCDGISSGVDRLRALGNAIVPQVAEQIFLAINSVDNQEKV